MNGRRHGLITASLATGLVTLTPGPAHALRDPLLPPAAARQPAPAAEGRDPGAARLPTIRHLVTVNGQRWVLDGARRFGPGDRLDGQRIDCILDSGVVVRSTDGKRRLLPLFDKVHIRPAGDSPFKAATHPQAPACPVSDMTTSKRSPR
jgi:hypothetical protein